MQRTLVSLIILLFTYPLSSQCTLSTGTYTQSQVLACLTNCTCAQVVIPTNTTVDLNGSWDLSSLSGLAIHIQGTGSLRFSGNGGSSEELNLSPSSNLIVEQPSNTAALVQTGGGGQLRITRGTEEFAGNDFPLLVAQGGLSPTTVLSIELSEFELSLLNANSVRLTWTTLSEKDNEGFFVERSVDGKEWGEIAWIEGAGQSEEAHNYEHIDQSELEGTVYYRLSSIDFAGEREVSPIRSIEKKQTFEQVYLYPNPTLGKVFLSNSTAVLSVQVYDVLGNLVMKQSDEFESMDLGHLKKGTYSVAVSLAGGQMSWSRLIKME